MPTQLQGEQSSTSSEQDNRRHKRFPGGRHHLVITIAITMLVLAAIWVLNNLGIIHGPWDRILGTIFIVLGVAFTFFQWLLPLSPRMPEYKHEILYPPSFLKETSEAEPEQLSMVTPHSTIWNVPYSRNKFFTGREEVLEYLHHMLIEDMTAPQKQPQAISGLGGVGKTQIVIEYAYRHRDTYRVVLWAKADSHEALISDFMTFAGLLKLPEKDEEDQKIVVEAVKRWLQDSMDWLLIFDNVEDMEMVKDFIPLEEKGHVLLTTRIQATGSIAQGIEIEKMTPNEGALLLLRRAKILSNATSVDRNIAREISRILDGLPLPLDQAGAYIEETACRLSDYLDIFRTRRAALLGQRGEHSSYYPQPVATTWSLSFEKVAQTNPAAAELLKFCAFLYPDAIPEEIFIQGAAELGPLLQDVAADPYKLNEAIKVLRKFSLVRRNPNAKTFTVHSLVQVVLKDGMSNNEQREWAVRTVKAINRTFPDTEFPPWQQCQRYLPHVQACAELIEQKDLAFMEAAQLLDRAGRYLQERTQNPLDIQTEPLFQERDQYDQAGQLLNQALAIYEQILGPEGSQVAITLNNLAWLYFNQGKYATAETLYQRALPIFEKTLEVEPPQVAQILNDLAWLYFNQGKYTEAGQLYQRALAIREKALGSEHPYVAQTINAQATLYRAQGMYIRAEELFKMALTIREKALGPEHPDVATSLNDLAWLYRTQGKYQEAEQLYQRVLAIRKKYVRPNHPQLATIYNDLALLYVDLGKYNDAEPLYQQALEIRENVLGPSHPRVALTLHNLAWLYFNQGQYSQAESLHLRALNIREQVLPEHPYVAQSLNALAEVYRAQARYVEAEPLYLRALAIREKALGPIHRHVATSLNNLAKLYTEQGKFAEAEPLYLLALAIREKTLGSQHSNVAQTLNDLALLCVEQGKYTGAEAHYLGALEIREKVLGSEHPHVAANLNNLARLYYSQGKYAKAEPLYQRALLIREQTLGPEHPYVAQSLNNLALLYATQKKYTKAEPLFQQALAIWEKTLGPEHPHVATVLANYADVLQKTNRKVKAAELKVRAELILDKHAGENTKQIEQKGRNPGMLTLTQSILKKPLGLVFDIDGTLSPIAPTPDEARLFPGVVPLLEEARKHAHVAIITGRGVEDGAAIVNVDGLTYIGTHGLEWCDGLPTLHPVQVVPEALAYVEPGNYLLDQAEKELAGLPGIIVQRKRVGGSIHYRLSPDPEQARQKIFAVLDSPARSVNMRLSEGKRIVEIQTPLAVSKGEALQRFVQRFGLQGVIFAGDDRTDLDAVLEIPNLRKEGVAALSVVVQHEDTLPVLLEHGDIIVQEVEGMVDLLREVVKLLMDFDDHRQQ